MAKLGAQVGASQRLTRTERVQAKQEEEKERKEYGRLKAEAEQIRETQFQDKEVEETYYEERPAKYTEKQWNSFSDSLKVTYLDEAKRRGLPIVRTAKTRTKTIPFTIEEGENSYSKAYEGIRPELRQFFLTPEEVKQQKSERIESTKTSIQEKISEAEQKKIEAQEKYKEKVRKYEEARERLRNQNLSEERYKKKVKQLKENLRDDENDLDEDVAYYNGLIKGYNQGLGELGKNKDIALKDLVSYADDVGDYERNREEARNESQAQQQEQQAQISDLLEQGYKPLLVQSTDKTGKTSAELTFINTEKQDVAKLTIPIQTKSTSSLTKSSLGRVPTTQQIEIGGQTFTFKTNEQLYVTKQGKLATQFQEYDVLEKDYIKEQEATKKAEVSFDYTAKDMSREGEIYSADVGGYLLAPYGLGAGGTAIIRPPTPEEKVKIEQAQYLGDKIGYQIVKTPQLALGGIFKVPLSPELKESTLPPSIKASGELFEQQKDIKEYNVMAEKLSDINREYDEGKIDYSTYQAKFNAYYDPELEARVNRYKTYTSLRQDLATAEFEEKGKVSVKKIPFLNIPYGVDIDLGGRGKALGLIGTIEAVSVVPYLTPGGRILLGGSQALEGAYQLGEAETPEERKAGYINLGLGSAVAFTGTQAGMSALSYVGEALPKAVTIGGGLAFAGGLAGYTGYEIYKESGDIPSAIAGGVGTLVPLAVAGGVQRYRNKKIAEENIKKEKINYLKEREAEAIKIAQERINAGQGERSYKELGKGSEVLSKPQQISLAKEYAKVTGSSFDDALKTIQERSIYQQTIKIQSDAPSYKRQIDYIKTGKAKTGENVLTYQRYGVSETTRLGDQSRSFALEFNLRGSKVSRVGAKSTIADSEAGLTEIYKKAYQKEGEGVEFRPKELLVTKTKKVKQVAREEGKIQYSETESRLLKSVSGKKLLEQERVSIEDLYKESQEVRPDQNLARINEAYEMAGEEAQKSYFRNIRVETPSYKTLKIEGFEGEVKLLEPGTYKFAQIGKGEGNLPTRIGFLKNYLKNQPSLKYKPKRIKFDETGSGETNIKDIILDMSSENQKLQFEQKKLTTTNLAEQINKGSFDFQFQNIKARKLDLEEVKIGQGEKVSTLQNLRDIGVDISTVETKLILKEKIKTKQKQGTKQRLDLQNKQLSALIIDQKTDLNLKQEIRNLTETNQRSLQKQALQVGVVEAPFTPSPSIRTPIEAIPETKPVEIPDVLLPMLRGKQPRRKKKAKDRIQQLVYLPDFTSRALGLEPEVVNIKGARTKLNQFFSGLEVRRGVIIE